VLGHDDVSDNHEAIPLADLFEDLEEQVAAPGGAEQWLAAITTARDKVKVSGTVVTRKAPGHGRRLESDGEGSSDRRHDGFVMKPWSDKH